MDTTPPDQTRRTILRGGAAAGMALLLPSCSRDSDDESCIAADRSTIGSLSTGALRLNQVPVGVQSTRLTYPGIDDMGVLWAGSVNRALYRYDPTRGHLDVIPHPFDTVVSHCICLGDKVYMLGQDYPRLMIYNRLSMTFSEYSYPVANPNIWYGAEEMYGLIDGRHLYLFDQASASIIKWDSFSDTGTLIAYPYSTPAPAIGRYIPFDNAIWCNVWDFDNLSYIPVGIARLDLATDNFTGFYPFPNDDTGLAPYTTPDDTLFYKWTFEGKLRPFDVRTRRYCEFLHVPGYNELFAWIGTSSVYQGRWYYTLSTYTGNRLGLDCKPYHFLNALLEFDPATGEFGFPTLDVPNSYYQISYILRAGNDFFAPSNNILAPDGQIDLGNEGELLFWQSVDPI